MLRMASVWLAVLLLMVTGGAAFAGTRQSLSGVWHLHRSSGEGTPTPSAAWQEVTVPSHLRTQAEPCAWYRRRFAVPGEWQGRHVFIAFGGVKYVSEVYVNGQHVGGHYGGWEPFEVDVTSVCRFGDANDLLVKVLDVRGLVDGEVSYESPWTLLDSADDRVVAPIGSQPNLFGIWQDVDLLAREAVFIDDVAVTTSMRQGRVEARYVVRNLGDGPRSVDVQAQVVDGAVAVLDMGLVSVTVPPGGTAEVELAETWANPKLWMPNSPHLYHLESRVTGGGRELDADRTRFGFREFWTDGIYFVLNGVRMKFLATAGHPPWDGYLLTDDEVRAKYEGIRSANCNAMRLHANIWPENWYEIADEVGLPIIQESAIWCHVEHYALGKEEFWQNAREHWRDVIRRDKNHPSVVMYSMENEILHVGGTRVAETEQNLGDLGRFVKSIDPTRPIMYDGDEDPDGAADVINLHYPHEFPNNTLYPKTCHWLNEPTRVEGWPYREWVWERNKPLYMGEFLWTPVPSAHSLTLFVGDEAYS
ncbi:MAG: glycoside hydrolase family 2 protein, partial [Planctomycetota bacterium]